MLIRISLTHILESSGIPDPAPKQLRIKCIIELPNSQYCPLMGEIGGMSILYGQKLCEPNSTWKSTHEKTTTNTFTIMHCLKPPRDQTDCTGHVPEKGSFQVPCYMNVVGGRLCIILDCPQQPQRNIMSVHTAWGTWGIMREPPWNLRKNHLNVSQYDSKKDKVCLSMFVIPFSDSRIFWETKGIFRLPLRG